VQPDQQQQRVPAGAEQRQLDARDGAVAMQHRQLDHAELGQAEATQASDPERL